jgi:hypothetical protein
MEQFRYLQWLYCRVDPRLRMLAPWGMEYWTRSRPSLAAMRWSEL